MTAAPGECVSVTPGIITMTAEQGNVGDVRYNLLLHLILCSSFPERVTCMSSL